MGEVELALAALREEVERQAEVRRDQLTAELGRSLGPAGDDEEGARQQEFVSATSGAYGEAYFEGMRDGFAALLDTMEQHPALVGRTGLGEVLDLVDELRSGVVGS